MDVKNTMITTQICATVLNVISLGLVAVCTNRKKCASRCLGCDKSADVAIVGKLCNSGGPMIIRFVERSNWKSLPSIPPQP